MGLGTILRSRLMWILVPLVLGAQSCGIKPKVATLATAVSNQLSNGNTTATPTATPAGAATITPVSGNAQSGVAGTPLANTLVAVVNDASSNPVSNTTVTWTVTSGNGVLTSCTSTSDASGLVSCVFSPDTTAGSNTVTATASGITTPATFTETGIAGAAAGITVVSGNLQSVTAGLPVSSNLVAVVKDSNFNVVSGTSVTWAVTAGGGATSSCTTTSDASGLVHCSFTTGTTAGTNTITATASGVATPATFTETGTAGTATTITVVSGNTQSGTAGAPLPGNLIAVVKDVNANVVAGNTVTWAVALGGGSVSACTTTSDAAGLVHCTFTPGLIAGTNIVTATATGVATPATFTETGVGGSAAGITIVSGNNQSAFAGSAVASNLVAVVKDINSNVVSGVTVTWAVTAGGGSTSACTTTTDASGLVHCAFTTGTTAGVNTITASASGVATPATFTENGTAGPATTITVVSGNTQSGTAGAPLPGNLIAVAKDANANVVTGTSVVWAVTAGGGAVSACTTTSDAAGLVHCIFSTGVVAGTNTVTATASGVATPATFTETGVAGTAAGITIVSGNNQSAVAGAAVASNLVAVVKDANSNTISGVTVTWAVTAGGGSTSACTTTSDASGLVHCAFTTGTTAGTNTITATATGVATPATFTETGTAGAATSITVVSGNSQSGTAGAPLPGNLIAVVKDANANVVAGNTVTWAVTVGSGVLTGCTTTSDAAGLVRCTFTPDIVAGANTVTATASGVATPATFTETGVAGGAASITVATGNTQSSTVGTSVASNLVAVVKDIHSNTIAGVTVAWAVTAGGGSTSACTTTSDASGLVHCAFTTGTTAGSNTITASVSGVASPATFTETGTAGTATAITVLSGNSQTITAGAPVPLNLVAVVKDTYANVVTGTSVVWAVTAGGGATSSCTTTSDVSGQVRCAFTTGTTIGTNTVTATASGVATPATFTETGIAGTATSIAIVSGNTQTAVAGQAVASNLVAVVKDINLNPVAAVAVTWAVTAGGGSTSACTTTSDASGLVQCTFTTGTTAGTNTITATASGVATPATFTETGIAGAATAITVLSGNTQSGTAGSPLPGNLIAVVKDVNLNVVSGKTVTWAVTAGGGAVSACTTTSDASGQVSCTFSLGASVGTNTVTATASGIATPATFTETGVAGAAAGITVVSGNNQSAVAGQAVASNLVAVVKDSNLNVISGVTVTWAVTAGGGSTSACTTTSDASGLVQCTFTTGTTAGVNTITATATGVATPATFSETGTAGTATSITVVSGNTQSGTAGSPLPGNLVAVVKDVNLNVVSGKTVTWAVTAGGGAVSACTTTSDASGQVRCTFTLGTTVGTNTVTATASGIATPATFTETGVAGAAAGITVVSGNNQSAVAGQAVASNLVAVVKDINANVISGITVTWAVTAGGGSTSACTTISDASGLVHCAFTTGTTAGTNTITATATGVATPASFTETGTAGTATSITVLSGNTQSGTAGSPLPGNLVAVVKDVNLNVVAGTTVTWAVSAGGGAVSACTTSSDASGQVRCTFSLGVTVGTNTVTATASGVATPATFTETGVAGAAAGITVLSGNNQSAVAGQALASNLVAVVKDTNGNVVTGTTVTWAVTAGGGTKSACTTTSSAAGLVQCTYTTGTTAGTNTITATATGIATPATFTETGTAGAATTIAVFSGNTQSGTAGSPLPGFLVAIVKDANLNVVPNASVAWAVTVGGGTLSACATTSDAAGKVTCTLSLGTIAGANSVTATASGVATPATFTATGTAGAAAGITTLSGNNQTGVAGAALASSLVAVVKDTNGNVVAGKTVVWAVTAGGGANSACTTTSDASGLVQCTYTTGVTAGVNTITATASGLATPAIFTETGVAGAAASITVVSGNNQSTTAGSAVTNSLVAVVKDINSNVASGKTVIWTIVSGGGTKSCTTTTDASGLVSCTFTTNATAGVSTITASVTGVATPATFTETGIAPPAINWNLTSLNFGLVKTTTTSYTQDFYYQNLDATSATGCNAPTLSNITDFSIVSDTCGTTSLVGGDQCKVQIRANPTTNGSKTATLSRTCLGILKTSALSATGYSNSSIAIKIASSFGGYHACAVMSDATLECWGWNAYGQLGNGTSTNSTVPILVPGLSGVTSVVAGYTHNCALINDGTVKCWGGNGYGQLGDGTTSSKSSPILVTGLSGVSSLSAGQYHTCAQLNDGTVKCWGQNTNGQLGDGTTTNQSSPTLVPSLSGVTSTTAGYRHSCALINDGTVKCWGWNAFGQLGDGTSTQRTSPTAVPALTGVTALSGGYYHTCSLLSAGTVKCWGNNSNSQLGDGTTTSQYSPVATVGLSGVSALSSGTFHNCALITGGTVKCWGYNYSGQLGDGTMTQQNNPTLVTGLSGASGISAGNNNTCALLSIGSVKCWGSNYYGQLGDGSTTSRSSPTVITGLSGVSSISLGGMHTCALMSDGTVKCWGSNSNGQLGDGTTTTHVIPTLVPGLSGVSSISLGLQHSCAVLSTGTVKCWGVNSQSQLGDGTNTDRSSPTLVPGLSGVSAVSTGMYFSCALLSSGTVKCWGYNFNGQIGDGTTTSRSSPTLVTGLSGVTAISSGQNFSCALLSDTTVKCWGYNQYGQIGDGTITDRSSPTVVTGLSGASAISVGASHGCVLLSGGSMKCWGGDYSGQLGDGSTTQQNTPVAVTGLSSASAISLGVNHSCALLSNGTVKCWGSNSSGQLGDGTKTDKYTPNIVPGLLSVTQIKSAGNSSTSCAIQSSGAVSCWGDNGSSQTGFNELTIRTVSGF